ncbi:ATP-binding protein [Streptomyces sp. 184]|uniref:HAMP domain-containing sensor histidine kinase n=1 Tax=Streptomyces sp. 184 TaxID=1827526 RepID=UPI0038916850
MTVPDGGGAEPGFWRRVWDALRPLDPVRSVNAALGALVIGSVVIATGLVWVAIRSSTEVRLITVFSLIASLLITQFVGQRLTSPLVQMTAVTRAMAHGDYTARLATRRRDEFGELAQTFNRMAADLQSVDRHRKELVANVSHELRTPIAALRAVLENVVDGVSEADPDTMRTALRQTERLGRLVEQLLDLSRIDSGVVPLRLRRFSVEQYLAGVLKEAHFGSGAHGAADAPEANGDAPGPRGRGDVRLHLDVWPPELVVRADAERLHQVMANLIDNAVKHSPPGGRVTVRARAGAQPDGLEVEVLDEGPGIPAAERHRVFERFNRGRETGLLGDHGADGGGTGLGLAIARWAVDLHGGRIGVAESPRGCRIRLTLPG